MSSKPRPKEDQLGEFIDVNKAADWDHGSNLSQTFEAKEEPHR